MERHIFFHPNEVCSFDSAIRLDCRHIHKSWMSNITFWDQRFLFIFPFTLPSWLQRTFQVVGLRLLWMIRETIKRWLIKLCGLGKKKKKKYILYNIREYSVRFIHVCGLAYFLPIDYIIQNIFFWLLWIQHRYSTTFLFNQENSLLSNIKSSDAEV